ncbi:hypothetical protein FACS189491_12560 [Spirochaetia bacterium]|nr:hypothetical protein FACS189491_12560 [Spirochaetia bacterium]
MSNTLDRGGEAQTFADSIGVKFTGPVYRTVKPAGNRDVLGQYSTEPFLDKGLPLFDDQNLFRFFAERTDGFYR